MLDCSPVRLIPALPLASALPYPLFPCSPQVEQELRHQKEMEERKNSKMAIVENEIVKASSQINQANMVAETLSAGWCFALKLVPYLDPDTKEKDVCSRQRPAPAAHLPHSTSESFLTHMHRTHKRRSCPLECPHA